MSASEKLARFSAQLQYEDIPANVVESTQWLLLDWLGSCLAGSNSRQANVFYQLARQQGPEQGPSTIIGREKTSSPYFAAMVNGAASHVVEQDDLHNTSIFHPATVVFPPALAAAESLEKCSGKQLITAAVVGYEAGIRVGEYLGGRHYRIFHTTATAGTIASAMAVSNILGLDENQTLDALGSAGTQAAGLWEFLGDAADSKQLHTAKASANGLIAALTAKEGLTGAKKILEGSQGLGAGLMAEGDIDVLVSDLGDRWTPPETSFKYYASCRHTHPAADAMAIIQRLDRFDPARIERIDVFVYQAAKDVLGAVIKPETIHQSKFSMGFVLALIALKGGAGVSDFTEEALGDADLMAFHDKVVMRVDDEIDAAYPQKWCARVEVSMDDGSVISHSVDTPKGDPGNFLTRSELEQKAINLVDYFGICQPTQVETLIDRVWELPNANSVKGIFSIS